jgi:hypothetical protein
MRRGPGLRHRLAARVLRHAGRQDRLPLLRRAGGQLRGQGRQGRGHGGTQVPVQRAAGQHRPSQTRKDQSVEPPLVTVGDDLNTVAQFLAPGRTSYGAADVVASLLSLTADGAAAELDEEPVSPPPDGLTC